MDLRNDMQNQVNDVISRLSSKQLFQSDWDIAAFAVFFIFIVQYAASGCLGDFIERRDLKTNTPLPANFTPRYGSVVLLLVILVLVRFCCCCCCDATEKPYRRKVGIENMALEP